MKIEISRKEMVEVLNGAARVINGKSPLEILQAFKITAKDNNISFLATDMTTSIAQTVICNVEETGEMVMPYKVIDLIRKLNDDVIRIEGDPATCHAYVISGKSRTFFSCYKAADFPQILKPKNIAAEIKASGKVFKESLGKVSYAASIDMTRPVFNGVLFDMTPEKLVLAATDTFRLSMAITDIKPSKEASLIVPSSIVKLISATCSNEEVTMAFSDTTLLIKTETTEIITKLIPGKYPAYQRLLPTEHKLKIKVNTKALKNAVERASIFMNENNLVKFELKDDSLEITAGEGSARYNEEIALQILSGDAGEISEVMLNGKFTQDIISNIASEEVEIKLTGQYAPVILKPFGDESQVALVVPLRVSAKSETAA